MDIIKFGKFVSERRKHLNLTQQMLGEKLSVTDKAVSKWERGISLPDAALWGSLAFELRCSIGELINGKMNNSESSNRLFGETETEDFVFDNTVIADISTCSTKIVSPYLFGNNLEHTRASVNSGISAQMLKNRKFTGKPGCIDKGCADKWHSLNKNVYLSFGKPYTRHNDGYRMNRKHERNAQDITNFSEGDISGIVQHDLYIEKDKEYEFRIVVKVYQPTNFVISLTDREGTEYANKTLFLTSSEFEEKKLILKSTAKSGYLSLNLYFKESGTVSIGAVSLMPADNFCGMRTDVIELMKEMGIKILRWPGGNFAGEYSWKDGLLPVDMRAPLESCLGIETQSHTAGYDFHEINTDDFVALCRKIGAEPFITINPAWNTPEESRQWVEYCNGDETTEYGKLRVERGFEEPYNVQFWSLGNEFGYGHMEGDNSPSGYCKVASMHGQSMLEKFPNLTLCSSGPYPNEEWIKHSAKPLKEMSSLVSLHSYMPYPEFKNSNCEKEEYEKCIAKVYSQAQALAYTMRNALNDNSIKISFDEWNTWYSWYRPESVYDGIFTASMLHMFMENSEKAGIDIACHFEAVNEGAIMVLPENAYLTPMGQMFSIMKKHINGIICFAEKDCIITKKDNILTATMINRSYDGNKKFIVPAIGKITVSDLYFSERVTPGSKFTIKNYNPDIIDGKYEIVLPKHSVMILQVEI